MIPCSPPRTSLLAIAAMVALGGSSATAHAESSESITVAGGKVSFIGHGNGLAARDTRKDGLCIRAVAEWWDVWTKPLSPRDVYACGAGTGDLERLPVPEGTRVRIRACYAKLPTGAGQCSDPQWAEA